MKLRPENEFETWKADEHPLTVEYASAVMDGIRSSVMEGLFRIARGGLEVGGVLFGKRKGDVVRILASRPLASEYASGPSFVLSEKDRDALSRIIESAQRDPELKGMVPVGWYHSHTRSGIFLSDHDLAIYDLHFPEPWQVSLVLRPERLKPLRAGFFIREAGGAVRTESSYREFVVQATGRRRANEGREGPDTAGAAAGSLSARPRRRLWIDWLLFTSAIVLVLAGALILARPFLFPRPPSPPSPDAAVLIRERDELRREAGKLRSEMELREGRIRELEEAVAGLEKKLGPRRSGGPQR